MYGALPGYRLAPLDYGLALDAAAASLAEYGPPYALCGCRELIGELHQRFAQPPTLPARCAVWVEPDERDWLHNLDQIGVSLVRGGLLAIVASRPLARLLPERRGWSARPIGVVPGGILRLRSALKAGGLRPLIERGFHSPAAIALVGLSRLATAAGQDARADRLRAAARMAYIVTRPTAALTTVALIVATKETSA